MLPFLFHFSCEIPQGSQLGYPLPRLCIKSSSDIGRITTKCKSAFTQDPNSSVDTVPVAYKPDMKPNIKPDLLISLANGNWSCKAIHFALSSRVNLQAVWSSGLGARFELWWSWIKVPLWPQCAGLFLVIPSWMLWQGSYIVHWSASCQLRFLISFYLADLSYLVPLRLIQWIAWKLALEATSVV